MKKVVVTQSNYIPWKGYFDALFLADEFILLDDVQYTRRDWRNRNKIKVPNGTQWLTLPVEVKGKFDQRICDTKISDPAWSVDHWKTLQNFYARARHFPTYAPQIEALYRTAADEPYLSRVNRIFLEGISGLLGFSPKISWSTDYELSAGKNERILSLCRQAQATDYYSGPAAKSYLDETLFRDQGIQVHYFDYSGYPEYTQLHPPFTHEVTVLDLLFNEGPQALNYLKAGSKK